MSSTTHENIVCKRCGIRLLGLINCVGVEPLCFECARSAVCSEPETNELAVLLGIEKRLGQISEALGKLLARQAGPHYHLQPGHEVLQVAGSVKITWTDPDSFAAIDQPEPPERVGLMAVGRDGRQRRSQPVVSGHGFVIEPGDVAVTWYPWGSELDPSATGDDQRPAQDAGNLPGGAADD